MFIYSSFQTVGSFSCITLQTKEEELMLKHCSHWYKCFLAGNDGKIVIWHQVVNLKMF